MSSLMGFLLALGPDERERIAAYWGLTAAEATPASLYGEMVDAWSLAVVRESLPAAARLVLDTVAAHASGIARRALAATLPLRDDELQATLEDLAARGLVLLGTEADHQLVKVLDEPRRALVELLRQATQAETFAPTLDRALSRLSLAELQRLAARWGIPQPETQLRREIEAALSRLLGTRETARQAAMRLSPGARRALTLLIRSGGRMAASDIRRRARIDERGLRAAARELAEAFLVRPSFAGGERALVAPVDLGGSDDAPTRRAGATPREVQGPPLAGPRFHALWDLLNLLAYLRFADPPVDRIPLSAAHQKRLATTLVFTEGDLEGRRLAFLLSLAQGLDLVAMVEGALRPAPSALCWEQMNFVAQSQPAYRWWLQTEHWREGLPQSERDPGGPLALPAGRERLVGSLRGLAPGRWYNLDGFLAAIGEKEPLLFRDREQVLLQAGNAGLERLARHWERWDGRLARAVLTTSLRWLGIVEVHAGDEGAAFTLTPLGAWLLGRPDAPPPPLPAQRSLAARSPFEVVVKWPDAPAIAALSRFATPAVAGGEVVYHVSAESVRRAVAEGLSPSNLFEVLARQGALSDGLRRAVGEWAATIRRFTLARCLLLEAETPEALDALLASARSRDLRLRRLSPTVAAVGDEQALAREMGRLHHDGFRFGPGAPANR